jgi:hypothetical protein
MQRIYKRGEIRDDGFICRNEKLQKFSSPESFAKEKQRHAEYKKLNPDPYKAYRNRTNEKPRKYDPIKGAEKRNKQKQAKALKIITSGIQKKERKKRLKKTHEEKRKTINEYVARRKATDPVYKLKITVRNRIKNMMVKLRLKKTANSISILGCNWIKFKNHIESQFTNGMTWENHGLHGWHLDHIIPLSCATTEKGVQVLSHYTNFQPKWAKDNLKKKDCLELHH